MTTTDRALDYFRPLGEWLDLAEMDLVISECARGGTVIDSFDFHIWNPADPFSRPSVPPAFFPYETEWCSRDDANPPPPPDDIAWHYDVAFLPSRVVVLGNQPACDDPPPDLGVRYVLGEASGAPGELLSVPVFAAADEPVSAIRLALESDPDAVSVEAMEIAVESVRTGEITHLVAERGGPFVFLNECEGLNCTGGIPWITTFFDTAEEHSVIEARISPGDLEVLDYPGPELVEIGRLRVRIREDFTGSETTLRVAVDPPLPTPDPIPDAATGAFLRFPDIGVFSPAVDVEDGLIRISGNDRAFRRGDGNADGNIDLSDALTSLNFLFLGGPRPGCMDAADADDSGRLELTDAVFLLNALFLGAGTLPEPWPGCGADPTDDGLGCGASDC